jgi:VCBS repeat-containing protein
MVGQLSAATSRATAQADDQCTINGTPGPDRLTGTPGHDVICAFAGDDVLRGLGGDDRLRGDDGDDVLNGGPGDDTLRGGRGNDVFIGGPGSDLADYVNHDDPITASIGNGPGDGPSGERDDIRPDVENLRGGTDDDSLRGSAGANKLRGHLGADTLRAGPGSDRMYGGIGADMLDARDAAAFTDHIVCGNGTDTAMADSGDRIGGGCENVNQNRAPTDILLSPASVVENQPAGTTVGTLSATDANNGDTHTFGLVPGAGGDDNGSFTIAGTALRTNAAFDYEAKQSYAVRVQVSDGRGGSYAEGLTVSVTDMAENRAPLAVDDSMTATEDVELVLPLSGLGSPAANDTDPDSDPLAVSAVSAAAGGGVSIAGGMIHFQPTPNLCGTAGFDYTVSDGKGGTDVGRASLTVTCVPDDPTVVDDTAIVPEDAAATTIDVLANDDDPDGDPVVIDSVTQPTNGSVAITNSGADLTYTPAIDFCGSDSFTYTVVGGFTADVDVTVTCVNDAPVVTGATVSLAENSANGTAVHTVPFADVDAGQSHTFAITAGNTNGAFAIDPTTGAITVADSTAVDFETTPTFSLTVQVTDDGTPPLSGSATITVNLTDTGEPPVVNAATFTLAEDAATGAAVGTVTFTDPDAGQTHTFAITAGNTGGAFAIGATSGAITVAQPLDFETTPTYSLTVEVTDNGVPALSGSATITVNLTNVNESPSIVAPTTVAANRDVALVIAGISVADPDAGDVELTLAVANGTLNVDETASAADVTGDGTATVVITGTVAEINTILGAGVTYLNDVGFPGATDTLQLTLDDPPFTVSATVTIQFNQVPVAADVVATTNEDTAVVVTLGATDGDDDDLTFSIVTGPANGTLGAIGTPDCTTVANTCTAQVTYTPNGDFNGGDQFTYQVDDGQDTDTGTASITVNAVNDAPVITLSGSTPSFTENGAAVTVDGGLTVTDVDNANLVSGTVSITAGSVAGDTLTFTPAGGIADNNGAPDVLALTGSATLADWQTVLRSVQYSTTSDNPTNATRTVSFVVNDGTLASNTAQKSVTVVPVNDAAVLDQPLAAALNYTENTAPTVIAPTITATDVDSTNLVSATIDIGAGYVNGQDVLSLGTNPQNGITAGPFDTANGTLTLTGSSSVANYQTALRDVRFANTSDNPTAGPRTVSFQVDDGSDPSNTVTRDVNIIPANDAPVGGDDPFLGVNGALANTRLAVSTTTTGPHLAVVGNVLANDTDPDTPSGLTAGPALISSANCAGCNNVALASGGTFIYDPPAGFTGTDTFTYTVNDNDPETPPNQTDTATVSIEVVGPLVWYVDIDAAAPPAGQGGRSHSPFNSLAPLSTGGAADGLDGAGDIIFVGIDTAPATGPYDGGIVLETNQRLWGEPFGLTVDPTGPIPSTTLVAANPATPVANNPNVRNSAAGGVGITLASGTEIQRVNAGITGTGSASWGIAGSAITTATIGPNQLVQGNASGITLIGAAGGDIAVAADINGNTGTAVNVTNRTSGTVTFSGQVIGSAPNANVTLTGNTGATIAFTGPINIAGGGSVSATFSAVGGGTITAANAVNQITSFTTTGISLNGVTVGAAGVAFNTVSSAIGGAANGILLTGVGGTGAFTVNGGAITATTRGLDVDGGAGGITVNASLTTSGAAARSVEVTNRTGGTVDVNGLVTESSLGINLSTNGTGLVRFDGGVVASTGTNPAFSATVSGSVAVTGAANTLTTTTGTALNVANNAIDASGLTFRSISAGGAPNGIVLNSTGSSGGLTVTGNSAGLCGGSVGSGPPALPAAPTAPNAADCTGGTIQNTSGPGIVLSATTNVSLTRVRVTGAGNDGVQATNVTNFSLASSLIEGNGNALNENNLDFGDASSITPDGLHGTGAITNSTVQNAFHRNISVRNSGGTALTSFNITGSQFRLSPSNGDADDNVLIEAGGTANMATSVSGSFFASTEGDHFQGAALNSGNLNVTLTSNTLTGGHSTPLGQGITINAATGVAFGGYTGRVDYDINGNNIQGAVSNGVSVVMGTTGLAGTFDGFVRNNVIGASGVALSCSTQANGVYIDARGNGTHTSQVSNNVIRQCFDRGILSEAGDGDSVLNLTVTGNTIDQQVGALTREAIQTNYGITSMNVFGNVDTNVVCLQLGGAGVLANTFSHGGGAPDDFRLRKRFEATVRLPGYAGGTGQDATSLGQVVAFIQGQNTGSAGEPGSAAASGTGGGYTGGAACPLPQ